eukprot:scaffold1786_cov138-Cylindrotheca_fusiformis.AAC.17
MPEPRSVPSSSLSPPENDSPRTRCVRVLAIVLAMGAFMWCTYTAVTGTMKLVSLKQSVGSEWLPADAMVVGTKHTNTSSTPTSGNNNSPGGTFRTASRSSNPSFFDLGTYGSVSAYRPYCAMISFSLSEDDDNADDFQKVQDESDDDDGNVITTTMRTLCVSEPRKINLGERFEILYNPDDPKEVMKTQDFHDTASSLTLAISLAIIFALCFFSCFLILWKKNITPLDLTYRTSRNVAPTEEELEQQRLRAEKFRNRFVFQTVLDDTSNITASQIRSNSKMAPEHDDDDVDVEKDFPKKEEKNEANAAESDIEQGKTVPESGADVRNLLAVAKEVAAASSRRLSCSWNNIGGGDHECCICMEEYRPGETVCVAKTTACNHVFHKSCIAAWVQNNHDGCPLCRMDLMKSP